MRFIELAILHVQVMQENLDHFSKLCLVEFRTRPEFRIRSGPVEFGLVPVPVRYR